MRYVLFIVIIIIAVYRYTKYNNLGKDNSFIWISLFIQLVPLSCILFKIYTLPYEVAMMGAFDSYFSIEGLWIICIIIWFVRARKKKDAIKLPTFFFILGLIIFELISFYNGNNSYPISGLPIGFRLLQLIFIVKFICLYVSKDQIIYGIFDGFKYAIYLQFFLTLLFPILGVEAVTRLFWDIGEWAHRRGVASAIGTFMHPGVLALFACMAASCFMACYLSEFKKRESLKFLIICAIIIFFTFSRTSYVTFVGVLFLLFLIYNKKKLYKSIFVISSGLLIILIIAHMLGIFDMFLASDFKDQQESRLIHFLLAFDCFNHSPYIGVGINNHVNFMSNDLINSDNLSFNSFFYANPIHNIHLIILAETGIIGLVIWLCCCIKYLMKSIKWVHYNIVYLIFIGILVSFCIYGMTGWGPFHRNIYPILLLLWCTIIGINISSKR